ncbi:MAG: fasciclin domain-containing protein [Candidatus Melainabacteria bacterium]|nr:fasciclin domain-containing protein [Candidatus Melainabacteria bacterium]
MQRNRVGPKSITGLLVIAALSISSSAPASASPGNSIKDGTRIASTKTERYKNKEGFERPTKDIINTLKDNEVTRFVTLLDGLSQAYDLDKKLKNNGPFTMFAICDHGFKRMPDEDVMSLFANKKKLRQVLEYSIVEGTFDSEALKKTKKFKTLEGHQITISEKGGNLYADKALIQTVDVPCSNGIIHILDGVAMPPLSK